VAVVVSFLQNDRFALSGSGSDCSMMDLLAVANAPDLPLSYDFLETFDVDGQLTTSNGGTFVLDAGEACSLDAPSACEDDTLSYVPASSGMSYVDTLTYTITDTDGELSPSGIVSVEVTAALIVNAGAVLDPVSEATRTLVLSISGGALANPGEGRYTVSLTEGPVRGTVSHSGVPLSAGSSFETNASALFFSYVSDDYATGSENIAFMVTDSDGTFGSDSFPFTVLPQAPFGAPAGGLVTGQLGAVMAQWSSTDGGKDNCLTGCHGPSGTAQDRFDMAASNLGVYFALLFGTSTDGLGVVKVVSDTTQRQNNPDASIILCYPSSTSGTANRCPGGGTLPVGSPHDGLLALPVSSPSYGVIRRWIQEGAQF
jgi:hypothetical protein